MHRLVKATTGVACLSTLCITLEAIMHGEPILKCHQCRECRNRNISLAGRSLLSLGRVSPHTGALGETTCVWSQRVRAPLREEYP